MSDIHYEPGDMLIATKGIGVSVLGTVRVGDVLQVVDVKENPDGIVDENGDPEYHMSVIFHGRLLRMGMDVYGDSEIVANKRSWEYAEGLSYWKVIE